MVRTRLVLTCMLLLSTAAAAAAQTGLGSLRGYIKDEQGGALPGVTVTATSPALIQPVTAVTDAAGYYRLINLPPGTYDRHRRADRVRDYKRAGHPAARRRELSGRHRR